MSNTKLHGFCLNVRFKVLGEREMFKQLTLIQRCDEIPGRWNKVVKGGQWTKSKDTHKIPVITFCK